MISEWDINIHGISNYYLLLITYHNGIINGSWFRKIVMMLMTTPCLSNSHRLWSRSASDGTFTTQNAAFLCIGIFVFKYSTSILRFYDILWYSMIFYDILWYSTSILRFYDILWYSMIFYDILRVLQMVKPQKRNPWMEKDNSPSIPGPVLV